MQLLQIWKPQGQVQQNGCVFPQQLHVYDLDFRERFFTSAMFWLQKKVVFLFKIENLVLWAGSSGPGFFTPASPGEAGDPENSP